MKYQTLINVSFVKAGSGSVTPRVNLPVSALQALGVTEKERTVVMNYDPDNQHITIKKYYPLETFDFDFEYKFIEKINDCYSKITSEYFDLMGITGSKDTFSMMFGGKEIKKEPCERDNRLLFNEETVVQTILRKKQIIIYVDELFFNNVNAQCYKKHIQKLKATLKELAENENLSFNESSEIVDE